MKLTKKEKVLKKRINVLTKKLEKYKELKEELKASKNWFSLLFNNANDAILVHEIKKGSPEKFTEVNAVACKRLGYTRKELLNMSPKDIDDPTQINTLPKVVKELRKKKHITFEMVHVAKNGRRIPVEISSHLIYLEGKPFSVAIARDISKRKRAEEERRKIEKGFRDLAGNAYDGIFIIAGKGRFIYVNKQVANITHYSVAELLDFGIKDLVHPKEHKKVMGRFKKRIKGEPAPPKYETLLIQKGGKEVPIELTAARTFWQGKPADIVIIRDITERKKAEKAIKESMDKLREANDKLKEVDRLKTDFLSLTSHELKTPLTPIKMYLDLFSDKSLGPLTKNQLSSLQTVRRNFERLEKLINQILDIVRIESKRMKFSFEPTDLDNLVKEVFTDMKAFARSKNISLKKNIQKGIPKVELDKMRISQVMLNLIGNAIKFSPKNKKVIVEATKKGPDLLVSIKDFGIGISQENQKKLFHKFYQVETKDTREISGLGLGLVISKGIIDSHKGKIWIRSQLGKGSTFYFTIPLKREKND
jgi:PAS domain S-box-containing protein